jgi:hypothetical protein
MNLIHEITSDTEDVAAFTETGGAIYVTTTIEEYMFITDMATPIIHADDWHAEGMDDAAMFLDPNIDLQKPGPSKYDIIPEPPPSPEDDNDLAQRLEEWFNQAEPGFIAKATEHGQSFLTAYKILVKIYPDRKKNFDAKLSKLLKVYLMSVLNNSQLEDPHALALLDFAKAGLVVQGSTSICSKKVEFFVDLLTQLLGFVERGVASDEGAEGDVQFRASRRAAAVSERQLF